MHSILCMLHMTDLEKMFLDAKVVHLKGKECHVHSLKANLLSKPQEKKEIRILC